jgi:hypothetical protein
VHKWSQLVKDLRNRLLGAKPKAEAEAQDLIHHAKWASPAQPLVTIYRSQTLAGRLLQAVNSDIPGQLKIQLTTPVLDKFGYDTTILPKETLAIASQEGKPQHGTARLALKLEQLELPSGEVVNLKATVGDQDGANGMAGKVNGHYGKLLLAAGTPSGFYQNPAQEAARDVGQSVQRDAQSVVDRELRVPPTITIPAGTICTINLGENIWREYYVCASACGGALGGSMWCVCLLGLLLLSACTLPPTPEVAPGDMASPTGTVFLSAPVERVEVLQVASSIETAALVPTPLAKRLASRPGREPNPVQLVAEAQKAARVYPTERGYFGASAEQVYAWMPGKVYVIFLAPNAGTGIFLPPGECMGAGLYLNPEAFEVKTERAGSDLMGYDVITVRPTSDKGEVDTFILTESRRRYLLHFVIGHVGMQAVTFEAPAIAQAMQEPRLILPRPAQ